MKYTDDFAHKQLKLVRSQIKEAIVENVRDLYVIVYGQNPNFDEDEEYVLDWEAISKSSYVRIPIEVYDTYIGDTCLEYHLVETVKVTLDGNLFFDLEDGDDEVEWRDVDVDHLALICDMIIRSLIHNTEAYGQES